MMMQHQQLREERMGMARAVREFLSENEISKTLSIRVKKYIDWKQRMARKLGKFDKVLGDLPIALQIDLQEEVKAPLIVHHRFFTALRAVHLRIFRLMCHSQLHTHFPAPGELVFTPHIDATRMFFCISGVSRYVDAAAHGNKGNRPAVRVEDMHETLRRTSEVPLKENPDEQGAQDEDEHGVVSLGRGSYLVEPVLWTSWEHCGVLMSVSDAQYYSLGGTSFEGLIVTHPPAHVSSILYARRFVAGLNRFGRKFNDIIDITGFEEEEESDEENDAVQQHAFTKKSMIGGIAGGSRLF
jgi:hypothetical protein